MVASQTLQNTKSEGKKILRDNVISRKEGKHFWNNSDRFLVSEILKFWNHFQFWEISILLQKYDIIYGLINYFSALFSCMVAHLSQRSNLTLIELRL